METRTKPDSSRTVELITAPETEGLVDDAREAKRKRVGPLTISMERRRLQLYTFLVLLDTVLILTAFAFVGLIYLGSLVDARQIDAAWIFIPLFLSFGLYNKVYSARALGSLAFSTAKTLATLGQAFALMLFILFYSKMSSEFSRGAVTLALLLSAAAVLASRVLITRFVAARWGPNPENVLVIEDGGPKVSLPYSYQLSAKEHDLDLHADDPNFLNRVGRLLVNMDRVVISCPANRRNEWAHVLRAAGVRGEVISEFAQSLGAVAIHSAGEQTTLVVSTGPLGLHARVTKRIIDLGIAISALLILMPLMVAIAAAIKLEDRGPILFRQRRIGRGNRFFNVLKFRSMKVAKTDRDGNQSTSRTDQRVTKVGAFIRKTSLDEIPQLINVLKGEMSLIGPRPHALGSKVDSKLFWEIDNRYWLRHSLKPGLTGLAQVNGFRGSTEKTRDLTERVRYDLEYIENWSVWLDLHILLRTVKVLIHTNAY